MNSPARLQLTGITKAYPGVVANSDVSLVVQPGEIHAVLGENGAGKSTLMKIIYGAAKPDAGSMTVDGIAALPANPQAARALGISMVFQHFSLFDTLSVAENVWLGLSKTESLASVSRRVADTAQAYGLDIDPARHVHSLSVGQMQRVEIIRALLTNPKILILDEPTSVLTPQAVDKLFVVLRQGLVLDESLKTTINQSIKTALSPRFVPNEIFQVQQVPRTLSGKKQELPIKKLLLGQPLEKVVNKEAMANPECLSWYEAFALARAQKTS